MYIYVATRGRPSSRLSTATPQQAPEKPETQTSSEYIPSQKLPTQRTETPTLRKITPKKRKSSSFNVVVPSKSSKSSSPTGSRPQSERRVTPEVAKDHSVPAKDHPQEPARPLKKRKVIRRVIEDSQPEFPKSIPVVEGTPLDASPKRQPPIVEPAKPVTPPPPSQQTPELQPLPQEEIRSRSRSRQATPLQPLSKSRHRSLSPVTKVDSWLSFDSDSNFDDEIPPTGIPPEHLHSGTLSQIHDPPSFETTANMNPIQPGQAGPNFTPIQATQFRQLTPGQNAAVQIIQQHRDSGPLPSLTNDS